MVMVIHNCDCATCKGSWSPQSKPGEFVFGGAICNCQCHDPKVDSTFFKWCMQKKDEEIAKLKEMLHAKG
jgi:hypothetical protein